MDIATVIGIISAFSLVLIAIMSGGMLSVFISIPSVMIVAGGTMGATLINYPLGQILGVANVLKKAFFHKLISSKSIIPLLVEFASKARKDGILALESMLKEVDDSFLQKGVQLAVDGLEPTSIREILEKEIEFLEERHSLGSEIFTTMGTFAPALGLIGTLIGLVQMLQSMEDPSSIGPAMAIALLTTFYGALLANLVFLPIAGKLKTRSKEEVLSKDLIREGILSIAAGDNPRIVEQKLHAFLAPKLRESSFDKK